MNMKVIFSGIKYPAEALKEFRPVWDLNLLAQLVEHCTGIKEIMGLNPINRPEHFFKALFSLLLK